MSSAGPSDGLETRRDDVTVLRPAPARAGRCPRCEVALTQPRVRITGWRMLWDGRCPACGHRYLVDLPSGHGLVYPAALDVDTGETLQASPAPWFADPLRDMFEHPDGGSVAMEIQGGGGKSATLLNCLDKVYGHALLKLLNAEMHLAEGRDLILLLPESLAVLVPDGVAETWIVREPTSRFGRWLLDLETRIDRELGRFDECVLSPAFPHPHPSSYRLSSFLGDIKSMRKGDPSVVFSLRADRTWGTDHEDQRERVSRLWKAVRAAFPGAGAVAVGPADPGGLPPEIEDDTDRRASHETERRWLALMKGADLAVGVHGSNLLLPSGLARATLELVPEGRYGNAFQATLFDTSDPVASLVAHRTLYGADDLSDLAPERVAKLAVSILRHGARTEALLSGPHAATAVSTFASAAPTDTVERAEEGGVDLRQIRPRRAAGRLARGAYGKVSEALRRRRAAAMDVPMRVTDERGLSFELETVDEVTRFAIESGHVEKAELALVSEFLEPGGIALDVGANIGLFSATMAQAVGPSGAVHAFEPLPTSRRRLQTTLDLNRLHWVRPNATVVSDVPGCAQLFDYGSGFESWATLVPREIGTPGGILRPTREVAVEAVTLDTYCDQHGIERIDLLKVDVEGAEERVLRGASTLLGRRAIDLVLVEVADTTLKAGGARAHALLDLLERHGLRTHSFENGRWHPFRIAGEYQQLANVVAASARARQRLRQLRLTD
jgi:FkbM family methyltransferase